MITFKPLFGWLAYHRISLKELAARSGVSYASIQNLHKNNAFTVSTLDKICLTLNLNIKDIMRYES